MVYSLPRYTSVNGIPVTELIDSEKLAQIVDRTKKGGGELVNLMGTSAWMAPGAAVVDMIESIARNQNRVLPVCVLLNGEYGFKDICLGVPVVLGKNGIEKVIIVDLNAEESKLLKDSATAVKEVMNVLDQMAII